MAAFEDTSIRAVMATIGGDDQITVLPYLDFEAIARNPKRFFGYSDNTNLLNALILSGVVSYHGGSTMVHLGRSNQMHPMTEASLRAALFDGGRFEIVAADTFTVNQLPWDDPENLQHQVSTRLATPWVWHGPPVHVTGRLWGGGLEILDWTMQVGRWIAAPEHYRDSVLFFRTLRSLGERGILGELAGLLVARPVSEPFGR
jgi:muramoyltetrapeptide carboxypeptidase LdcA involved in peptidoglycan recycling